MFEFAQPWGDGGARAGVLGGRVHAFRFDPAAGVQRMPLPGGFEVASDAVLHWAFYADGPDAAVAPHAALAVTIDVVFERGPGSPEERLSEHPDAREVGPTDDHLEGFAGHPAAEEGVEVRGGGRRGAQDRRLVLGEDAARRP